MRTKRMSAVFLFLSVFATGTLFADGYEPEDYPPDLSFAKSDSKEKKETLPPSLEKIKRKVSSFDLERRKFEDREAKTSIPTAKSSEKKEKAIDSDKKKGISPVKRIYGPSSFLADGFTEKFFLKRCDDDRGCVKKREESSFCDEESSICLSYEGETKEYRNDRIPAYVGYFNVNGKKTAVVRTGDGRTVHLSEGMRIGDYMVKNINPLYITLDDGKRGETTVPFSGT